MFELLVLVRLVLPEVPESSVCSVRANAGANDCALARADVLANVRALSRSDARAFVLRSVTLKACEGGGP